jgi:hypothetical protein
MKISQLDKINKLYFTVEDLARVLEVTIPSARVSAVRYCSKGYIIRVKRGIYVLASRWKNLTEKEVFTLANLIQVPSYISLTTALSYYGASSQIQQGYIESISLKRTKSLEVGEVFFNYTRIGKGLYKGFYRKDGFFIASAEKAFLDALYLSSLGKYSLDTAAIDRRKINSAQLLKQVKIFPNNVKKEVKKWIS